MLLPLRQTSPRGHGAETPEPRSQSATINNSDG
jgi:hypothetical protein